MPVFSLGWRRPRGARAWLVFVHRWFGVLLCLAFAFWFASGAVLLFVPFPALDPGEQLARSEPVAATQVRVSPTAALRVAGLPAPDGLRLIAADGQPRYVVEDATAPFVRVIDAARGSPAALLDPAAAGRIAQRFSGVALSDIVVAGPLQVDQWTVQQRFDPLRPLYRADLGDGQGTELYVSARTGEVVQRTTRFARGWNWCGAILHWWYLTPIRARFALWNWLVWCVALAGVVVALAGTWLGWQRYRTWRCAGRSGLSPYQGWMRWHHVLGLCSALFVVAWIGSGWLSMDHGRFFSRGEPSMVQRAAVQGVSLPTAFAQADLPIGFAAPVMRYDFVAMGGQPWVVARGDGAPRLRRADRQMQPALPALPLALVDRAVHAAWPAAVALPPLRGQMLYALAEGLPEGTLRYRAGAEVVYLDPYLGRVLKVMDRSRRAYAWLYYAVHTYSFAGLGAHPWLRRGLMLLPLLLGFVFCITAVVIGYRRLRLHTR